MGTRRRLRRLRVRVRVRVSFAGFSPAIRVSGGVRVSRVGYEAALSPAPQCPIVLLNIEIVMGDVCPP